MTDLPLLQKAPPRWAGAAVSAGAVFLLVAVVLALSAARLGQNLSPTAFGHVMAAAGQGDMTAAIFLYADLPRITIALMAGAMLALSGVLFQEVLLNPLAEPTTLGVSAGAQLALALATLYTPALVSFGKEWVCLAGSTASLCVVLLLGMGRGFSSVTVILAGLIVSLFAGAAEAILNILNHQRLVSVAIWSTGVLTQNGWAPTLFLAERLPLLAIAAWALVRPMALLALDETTARGLGIPVAASRLLVLALAAALAACVVGAVGVIGFVGLAAPALARHAGGRRLSVRIWLAPLLGAGLLLAADQSVLALAPWLPSLPTGTLTALIGAPILLWMMRMRPAPGGITPSMDSGSPRAARPATRVAGLAIAVAVAALVAVSFGRGPAGWTVDTGPTFDALLPWRWPRLMAASGAGLLLAVAGVVLQRLTGNPLASPEVLGVAPAAGLGMIAATLLIPAPDAGDRFLAAASGAALALVLLLAFARRTHAVPERVLLLGVAIATAFGALATALTASGDPRLTGLLSWMAGSTTDATPRDALGVLAMAAAGMGASPLLARWLLILPLGEETARSLGLPLRGSRLVLLVFAAAATAAATLAIGPFSFVGLMAPHMARMLGLRSPLSQIAGAALCGALVMLAADWLGRTLAFPYEIPAGLVAAGIGCPYLLIVLARKPGGTRP